MTYNSDELVQYLSLSNLIQLRYVIDADTLEVFQASPGGKQVLYEGDLSGWLLRLFGGEEEAHSEKVEAFRRDMQQGTASFQYEFQVKDTQYSLRCKTEGGRICYGISWAPPPISFSGGHRTRTPCWIC